MCLVYILLSCIFEYFAHNFSDGNPDQCVIWCLNILTWTWTSTGHISNQQAADVFTLFFLSLWWSRRRMRSWRRMRRRRRRRRRRRGRGGGGGGGGRRVQKSRVHYSAGYQMCWWKLNPPWLKASVLLYNTVLYCIVLYCTVLYCTVQ